MKTKIDNLFETLRSPLRFLWRVIRKFHSNKGMILAGAIAYNTLLSIIPAFTLLLIILSRLVDDQTLLVAIENNLKLVIPGLTDTLLKHTAEFLDYRSVVGWISVVVMLFFSSIAFMVLENTMAVIFSHRAKTNKRHFIISAIMPYIFTVVLVLALSIATLMSGALETMEGKRLTILFWTIHLDKVNDITLYLLGFGGLIVLLSSIYMVLPTGGIKMRYALIGGTAAAVLWEIVRHFLIWYFSTLSIVNVIYGSMATAIVALLSLEVAGVILLFGAQFIAEYEQIRDKSGLLVGTKT
jgi:YihY family inner membrane protein